MPFEIIWSDSAARQLKKLDRTVARRIFDKVGELRETPHRFVRKLANSPYYRLRIGDYRVILDIQETVLRILVLKVGHRKSIYRRNGHRRGMPFKSHPVHFSVKGTVAVRTGRLKVALLTTAGRRSEDCHEGSHK